MICSQVSDSLLSIAVSSRSCESYLHNSRVRVRSAHLLQRDLQRTSSMGYFGKGIQSLASYVGQTHSVHTAVVIDLLHLERVDSSSALDGCNEMPTNPTASSEDTITLEFAISYRRAWYEIIAITPWDKSHFNIRMVKRWIKCSEPKRHADDIHGGRRREHKAKPPLQEFRLIDTFHQRIVRVGQTVERYVALSYVWGSTPSGVERQFQLTRNTCEEAGKQGSLSEFRLPPIISDAITLCRDLGERYLWIDRLCVVQDDPASKYSQISAMDVIYEQATFTIISLADDRICHGIPGVSGRPRPELNRALEVGRGGNVYNNVTKLVKKSRWNSRGWTFQEQMLSKRQLYIAENHIFLVSSGQLREEEPLDDSYDPVMLSHHLGFVFLDGPRDITAQREYLQIVGEYKTRALTFKSDILNAFSGISARLEETLATEIIFGHPKSFIGETLLWGHTKVMREQDKSLGLPSWSWAAWDGPIKYNALPFSTSENLVVFYYCGTNGVVSCSQGDHHDGHGWVYNPPANTSEQDIRLRFKSYVHHLMWTEFGQPGDEAVELWEHCCHNPWNNSRQRRLSTLDLAQAAAHPGCLVFNTTIANFQLRTPASNNTHGKSTQTVSTEVMMTLDIADEDGNIVGQTAEVSLEWMQSNEVLHGLQSFVVISAARHDAQELRESHKTREAWEMRDVSLDVDDIFRLFVMLVKSHGDGIFSRVTIGVISLSAWSKARTKWQIVTLR